MSTGAVVELILAIAAGVLFVVAVFILELFKTNKVQFMVLLGCLCLDVAFILHVVKLN